MGALLVDFVRLIIIILFLPLIIIFIGPLLILTAIRGRQQMGPITLDSTRYNFAGKAGIFMLGLAIWLLVWSALVWLILSALSLTPALSLAPGAEIAPVAPPPVTTVIEPTAKPQATVTATPSPSPVPVTHTPTPLPSTPTFTPTPTSTLGPIVPGNAGASTVTPTPTTLFNEPLATNTPAAVIAETTTATATVFSSASDTIIVATVSPADRQSAVTTLEEANLLLQKAIGLANEENLEALGTIWQGEAQAGITEFAFELYDRYAKPLTVGFEYLSPPRVTGQNSANDIVITTKEEWSYGGPTTVNRESFEFTYTLTQKGGRWVITKYRYLNLPLPTPTTIPLTPTPPQN